MICIRTLIILAIATTSVAADPIVVGNHRGGLLRGMLAEIEEIRQSGTSVEIRGRVCQSTCTMYLGAPKVCVMPDTRFGFHGPSSYGRALEPNVFNQASRVIASHYPPAIRDWYMSEARHRIQRLSVLRGAELIRHGVAECPNP